MFRTTTTPAGRTRVECVRCGAVDVLPPGPAALARWKTTHAATCPAAGKETGR